MSKLSLDVDLANLAQAFKSFGIAATSAQVAASALVDASRRLGGISIERDMFRRVLVIRVGNRTHEVTYELMETADSNVEVIQRILQLIDNTEHSTSTAASTPQKVSFTRVRRLRLRVK